MPMGDGFSIKRTIFAVPIFHHAIIPVKEGENIERALKRFKKKFDRTKTVACCVPGRSTSSRRRFVARR